MNIINEIGKFFLSLNTHIADTQDSISYQKDFLLKLIENNKNTLYGKTYHFDKITSIQDFQKYVPITQYSDYKTYIDQSMQGQSDILIK